MSDILRLDAVSLAYGRLTAVDKVSLSVPKGARHALIGPNGAGKSSLFSVVAGIRPPTSGRIEFDGADVTEVSEAGRAAGGLVRTYQHSSLFLGCTVLDNVRLAAERVHGRPLRPFRRRRRDAEVTERAHAHLASAGLPGRHGHLAGSLSHGERRQLEVAMVLACEPSLVLFDEPTAGMSAAETDRFAELVERLPEELSMVIVEHDLDVVFRLARQVTVLAAGSVIASGTPDEVRADEHVQRAYLGADSTDELFTEAS
ncbi:ABC transporter ATP-binding protein [Nonomuraea sp. NPDC048916]|uniref:ABC transporter ATP-binding protein n=1 Tax=Nonomuraea sp. NPDC048916 TaxID=3154232 RepID=UPI0033EB1D17